MEEFKDNKTIINELIKKKDLKTIPFLTKFEKARVLGIRAEQLANNAKPLVDITEFLDVQQQSLKIARKELKMGKLPLIIVRPLSNGKTERIRVSDLIVIED